MTFRECATPGNRSSTPLSVSEIDRTAESLAKGSTTVLPSRRDGPTHGGHVSRFGMERTTTPPMYTTAV